MKDGNNQKRKLINNKKTKNKSKIKKTPKSEQN